MTTTDQGGTRLLVCNCDKTMNIDGATLAQHLGQDEPVNVHTQLCRRQVASFEAALAGDNQLVVACTQEAPLFREIAEEKGAENISFVNIRERAGWCERTEDATPKVIALLAEQNHASQPTGLMTIKSEGQCLVYGAGQTAIDVAAQLAGRLNVTAILTDVSDAVPPATGDVPMHCGKIRSASGALGSFELTIDQFAPSLPSSRNELKFEAPRDNFSTTCDLIFDLSDGRALFSDSLGRDGYFKVDANHPAGIAEAMFEISDLVGEFEKPLYVSYSPDICAHSRSQKIGCRNCLDSCPAGAITPAGDNVVINPAICGGCGTCSAVCPTGAASYAYPQRLDIIRRVQILAAAFNGAGGRDPVLLIHDDNHGAGLIAMMARYGRGLPTDTIPLGVFSVFQTGHETIAAAIAAGFSHVAIAAPPDKQHDLPALEGQVALAQSFLEALGYGDGRVSIAVESDPDALEAYLHALERPTAVAAKAFAATGGKRDVARITLNALNQAAPAPQESIELPAGAPYGRLKIDTENCTLCLACVGACPAGALSDDEERPRLSFTETACVQCGLCIATCPERVIQLEPRYTFTEDVLRPVMMKEEEPFECISCGKPFGTKSTIESIIKKLEGRHAMFQNSQQIDIIKMCDDCRVIAVSNAGGDPLTMGERPRVRTTDDYLIGDTQDEDA